MAPLERIFEADIRNLFDTDVIGTMRVTQQFISHFKKRCAGVILTVTLLAGTIAFLRDAVYGTAKRAQEDMVESLYYEMEPFGVAVKLIIPGGTKTNFRTPLNDLTGYERAATNQRKYIPCSVSRRSRRHHLAGRHERKRPVAISGRQRLPETLRTVHRHGHRGFQAVFFADIV